MGSRRGSKARGARTSPTDDRPAGAAPSSMYQQATKHLVALDDALQPSGLLVVLESKRTGPPRLVITNPKVERLSETIYAAPVRVGTRAEAWWFWWSWADRICPVKQLDETARKIALVLRERNER